MADSNFRPFRSRDSLTREDVDPTSDAARDPLAELARIIGQSNRVNDFDRDPRDDQRLDPRNDPRRSVVQTLDEPLPATADRDWAADDGYAEPDVPEQYPEQHPDQYAEDNYVQPRLPDPYPADPAHRAYGRHDRDDERAPSIASQYSEPAEPYDDPHDDETAHDARYRDEDPPRPAGRQPALAPQSHDDEYEAEEQWDDRADRQSDGAEDYYDDETPAKPRRSGLVVVLAMVGLVMIGAGGAFAYRSMFGGAILTPSLPPVIKANDAPNKILPNRNDAAASNPAGASTPGAPEKLVSREEQPVAIQPPNAPPRVVSTIPVLPAPGAAPAGPPATIAPSLSAVPAQPSAPPKVAAIRLNRLRHRWPGQANPKRSTPSPSARTRSVTATLRPPHRRLPRLRLQCGPKQPKRPPVRRHPRPAATRRSPSCRSRKAQPRRRLRSRRRAPVWRVPKPLPPRSPPHPPQRRPLAVMRCRSLRNALRPRPRPSSNRSRPNSRASSAAVSRSSIALIWATKAPSIAPWSAPLPPRRLPLPCAAI